MSIEDMPDSEIRDRAKRRGHDPQQVDVLLRRREDPQAAELLAEWADA